jgi:hypothetical protein
MAKKQTSFADKAAKLGKEADAVYVKYVKSLKSEKTGQWRFNEQIVRTSKSESLDAALKRINDAANLTDIDLSQFENQSNVNNTSESNLNDNKESLLETSEQRDIDQSISDENIDNKLGQADTEDIADNKTEIDQLEEE